MATPAVPERPWTSATAARCSLTANSWQRERCGVGGASAAQNRRADCGAGPALERNDLGCYSTVIKVGDTYHMWYASHPGFCYARSKDGIKWEKPSLGLAEFEGSRDNNIVLGCGAGGMISSAPRAWCFTTRKPRRTRSSAAPRASRMS